MRGRGAAPRGRRAARPASPPARGVSRTRSTFWRRRLTTSGRVTLASPRTAPFDAQLGASLALVGEAAVVADEDGVVLGLNDRAEVMFGYSAEELVGRAMPAVLPGFDS